MSGPAWGQSGRISIPEEETKLGDGTVALELLGAGNNHKS